MSNSSANGTQPATPTEVRLRLLQRGYHPLPVNGKRPVAEAWQTMLHTEPEDIDQWAAIWPAAGNTGVLTRTTPVLDIDIRSPDAARAAEDLVRDRFGDADILVRIGNAPKRAIPFRTKTPFDKINASLVAPNATEGDPPEKLEFLCDGQQVVVAGTHPDTGKPYVWFGKDIIDIPHADLPHVTGAEARQLFDDIVEILVAEHGYSIVKPPKKANGTAHDDGESLDWAQLTADVIVGRDLHDSTRDLAATWIGSGMSAKNALRQLRALMLANPGSRDERWQARYDDLARIVGDVEAKFGNGAQAAELAFVDMRAWDQAAPPPRPWWLVNRFPLRQPSLVSGVGGIGKSVLLLQLLTATALGVPWLDTFDLAPGRVLYLGAEDDPDEIHRRLAAILEHHRCKFADLIERGFKALAFAGKDATLATFDPRSGRIKPTALFEQLYEQARMLKPRGIVIDPVSDVFLGDEIKREQVRQFGGLLRKLAIDADCGLIIASHPSLTGIKSGSGLSGSTQWHNTARSRAFFRLPRRDDAEEGEDGADDGRRELAWHKNSYGPLAESITLEWRNGLWLPPAPDAPAPQTDVEDLFLRLLARFAEQGRSVSPNKGPAYAPTMFAAQPEVLATRVSSKALANAMERLLLARRIVTVNDGTSAKPRIYLAVPQKALL